MHLKYELLPAEERATRNGETVLVHRLKALQDIPAVNIEAGDLGGFVSGEAVLSHEGNCWIDGFAVVIDSIIKDNAQVKHTAFVRGSVVEKDAIVMESANVDRQTHITDASRVGGNAKVHGEGDAMTLIQDGALVSGNARIKNCTISESARVWGNAVLENSQVKGNSIAEGKSVINDSTLQDSSYATEDSTVNNSTLKDKASVLGNAVVADSTLADRTEISDYAVITGSTVTGDSHLYGSAKVSSTEVHSMVDEGVDPYYGSAMNALIPGALLTPDVPLKETSTSEGTTKISLAGNPALKTLEDLEADYTGYLYDVSKLCQYPALVDMGNRESLALAKALRKARAAADAGNPELLAETVDVAEDAFLVAIAFARKVGLTQFSDEDKESIRQASDAVARAMDPYQAEDNRRDAFKQVWKALEGVIPVSDEAVLTLEGEIGVGPLER